MIKKFLSLMLCSLLFFCMVTTSFANIHSISEEKIEIVKNSKPSIDLNNVKDKLNNDNEKNIKKSFSSNLKKDKLDIQLNLVDIKNIEIDQLKFIQYYYKPTSKSLNKVSNLGGIEEDNFTNLARAYTPEEGDFRVTVGLGELSGKDWFPGDITVYNSYLLTEESYDASHIYTYLISNPIINYFTNTAIDLIEQGHKGNGRAFSSERRAHKWGEIYNNGRWIEYYYGKQDEIYWGQLIDVYSTDEHNYGDQIYREEFFYEPVDGYNPIFVDHTKRFRDDDLIYEVAYGQYVHDAYRINDTYNSDNEFDPTYRYKWENDWNEGVEKTY